MKRSAWVVVAILLTGWGAAYAQAPNLDEMDIVLKSVPDGPVAKVEGQVIERYQFVRLYQNELQRVIQEKGDAVPDGARAQLGLWCVATLVERALLYEEALKRGVTVEPEKVEKAWDAQLGQMQEALRKRDGRDVSEEEVLERMGFAKREDVLADLERALVTERMRGIVIRESGATVSDEKIREIFDSQKDQFSTPGRLHLQQIYVNPRELSGSPEEKEKLARERAEQVIDRVYAGQRFDAVARTMSDSPDAESGGDMGDLPVEQLPPFMVNAAMGLKPGDVSDVLESEFGYHVICLLSFDEPKSLEFEAVAPVIRRQILAQEGSQTVHTYCDRLIQDGAKVRVFLELQKNLVLNGAPPDETGG